MTQKDFIIKVNKIRQMMSLRGIFGIIISEMENFTWLTGGRKVVRLTDGRCVSRMIIDLNQIYFIVDMIDKEYGGFEDQIDFPNNIITIPCYDFRKKIEFFDFINQMGRIEEDSNFEHEFTELRSVLTEDEMLQYRWLGRISAEIVEDSAKEVCSCVKREEIIDSIVNKAKMTDLELVKVNVDFDKTIFNKNNRYSNRLEKYAMIVAVIRKEGLNVSCTRFVSIGNPDYDLIKKVRAVAEIDSAMITNTRPGKSIKGIYESAIEVCKKNGYKEEFIENSKGGLAGFQVSKDCAISSFRNFVRLHQAYTWKPSIRGARSQDTILVDDESNHIITHTGNYEYIETEYLGRKLIRPSILVKKSKGNFVSQSIVS